MGDFAEVFAFFQRMAVQFLGWLLRIHWTIPMLAGGFFLCKVCAAFLPLRPGRRWRALLLVLMGGVSGMVIWVGDNNLLFTLPVFFLVLMACSSGDWTGRLAVTSIFFCLIMSANALLDTYYIRIGSVRLGDGHLHVPDFFYYSSKLLRPVLAGLLYLALRKRLPDCPPRLTGKLWRLVLLLASMPVSSLLAVVVLTQNKYDNETVYTTFMSMGITVLPFVLLTALALLYAILVLVDHQRLEEADKLASLRESYYQGLQREERQVRTMRHDLRNHLTALRGLMELGDRERALQYIDQLTASPALQGGQRLCENNAANAVLSAKAEAMRREGVEVEFSISLPASLPIGEADLCALLGNALDNALEAAAQSPEKWATVRCRTEKGLFMLRVENALSGPLPPGLSTTKKDKAAHGFGLAGMREIAERYGGSLEVKAGAGRFELVACLPLAQG